MGREEKAEDLTMSKDDSEFIEYEIGEKRNKIYVLGNLENDEIWVDFNALPKSAFLCALCDCPSLLQAKCGEHGRKKRTFVSIEWAINEWGGPKEIVEALQKRKKMTLQDLAAKRKNLQQKVEV